MDGQIVRKKNSRRQKCDVVFLDELDTELTQKLDAGDFSEPYTTIIMFCVTNKHKFIIGDARMQSPTTKKFCIRASHVWGDRRLQLAQVQCTSLHLEEPPAWSRYPLCQVS